MGNQHSHIVNDDLNLNDDKSGEKSHSMSPAVSIPVNKASVSGYSESLPLAAPLNQPNDSLFSTSVPPFLVEEEFQKNTITSNLGDPIKDFFIGTNIPIGSCKIICWKHGGKEVFVTGSFNQWLEKIPLQKQVDGEFTVILYLKEGSHRLKFIVDDEWRCSPDFLSAADPRNQLVNVIEVTALKKDSFLFNTEPIVGTPPGIFNDGQYTKEIPEYLLQENISDSRYPSQPLFLPPQLSADILNTQPVSETDYSTLPTPNHVTLHHLYAQSIRDGVMALGMISRYREKFISTIMYRPVITE